MARILHLKASPMGDLAYSIRAAKVFFDTYRSANPLDSIVEKDLWQADLADFDFVAASGKYKVMRGLAHTEEEAGAWRRVIETVEELKSVDKVVVSTGMWNFSIPYRLKQYLDIIIQPGLTFAFDPAQGYSGLITGKKLQLILASGGEYPAGTAMAAYDFQKPYLEMIFGFIGFTNINTIRVEGTLSPAGPDNLVRAEEQLLKAARNF
jgi:FMN-dependent NADH-azoreductase